VTVAVASVDGGGRRGGSRRAALLAGMAVVAVLALAVASSRLFPVERDAFVTPSEVPSASVPIAGVPSPLASPRGSPAPSPVVAMTPRVAADPLDVSALVAAVRAGKDGPIAFVSGLLHITPRRCDPGAPASACYLLAIDGLRGVRVVPDDGLAMPMRQPAGGEALVLLPRAGRLVYLGSLVVDPGGIPRIDGLIAQLARHGPAIAGTGPTLYEADGRIIRLSHDCPETASCPPASWLFGALQPPDNLVVGVVDASVVDGAPGLDASVEWASGPFLLRPGTVTSASWIVLAQEDQAAILHIVIP
jgi:hypothetical protein